MSNILVNDENQPAASAFAALPSAQDLADASRLEQEAANAPAPVEAAPVDDGLPDKFKGKTAAEIARSYADLESEFGRKAQEVGTLRSLTDQLLEVKRTEDLNNNGGQAEVTEITADDLLADPRNAIAAVAGEATSAATQRVDALEAQLAMRDFEARYPTFRQDQSDASFQEYVRKSNYRSNLAAKASQGDLDAAEELWSSYSEVREAAPADTTKQETVADEQQALETATAIASSGGQGGAAPAQPISRADIIKKRIEDPDGYYDPTFQSWLTGMYQKGLVK